MPIEVNSPIRVFLHDEFHALAHRILGIVFGVHNEFGRLLDEEIYKQAIRRRCETAGIAPALREVEIRVHHGSFLRSYFMDLLFASGVILETKAVDVLTDAHQSQTLNYLLLAGMRHGLLLNLRSAQVTWRYVSTTLDAAERRRFTVQDSQWIAINEASRDLRAIFIELLDDWGAFLETPLYRAAVMHFFGGPAVTLRRIGIYDDDTLLGTHEVCLIGDDTAFALSALKSGKKEMQDHLQRFLTHTQLNAVQWINMDNHDIEFQTLVRRGSKRTGRMMGAE
ncbi:MAG TPA: GxxExxY protein [Candidatus Anammoximicrobium sp.]|nr:GxxExxY protein [Candidatus Anammoximicrobium sp.]